MLPEMLEDPPGSFMMEGKIILGVNAHVIHVNFEPFLHDHVCTYVIHECLEHRGGIGESEEHDCGFKQSQQGDECCLPLVLFPKSNVIIPPSDVELGEERRVLHIVD